MTTTDTQQSLTVELVRTVDEVLTRECPLAVVRECAHSDTRWQTLWQIASDLGWPALGVPQDLGGIGLGVAAAVDVLERAGAALFPAPLLSTTAAVAVLSSLSHTESPAAEALGRIAHGAVATLAVVDADEHSVVRWDHTGLTGTKTDVTDLPRAELFVVTAMPADDQAATVAVVDTGAERRVRENIDPTRPLGELVLRHTPGLYAGTGPDRGLAAARLLVAAELVGVAQRALDVATAHARERVQFGRRIGAFQAVKHRLADMYVAVERARSLVRAAAADLDDEPASALSRGLLGPLGTAVAMARAAASEAALLAARGAIQVSGALGITDEYDLIHVLRRAQQGAHVLGDPRRDYAAVGAALVEELR